MWQRADRMKKLLKKIVKPFDKVLVRDYLGSSWKLAQYGFEDKELNEITPELENLKVSDRITYLKEFFNLAVFKMFINVLNLYQDQGGNILSMSDELISESTRIVKSVSESLSESNRYLGQFLLLWIMSVAVLLFIRFSISSFYTSMLKSSVFVGFLIIFFILILFSIHLFIVRYSSIVVKEDQVK